MGQLKHLLISDGADESALYFIRQTATLRDQVAQLTTALEDLLHMPEYDGTRQTSQVRLRAKNQAKKALKAVHETSRSLPASSTVLQAGAS